MLIVPARVSNAASARVRDALPDMQRSLALVQAGRPFDAEPDPSRRVANAANLLSISRGAAKDLLEHRPAANLPLPKSTRIMAEAIQATRLTGSRSGGSGGRWRLRVPSCGS